MTGGYESCHIFNRNLQLYWKHFSSAKEFLYRVEPIIPSIPIQKFRSWLLKSPQNTTLLNRIS